MYCRKFSAWILTVAMIISIFSAIPVSANTESIDDNLVMHYDFEGADSTEAMQDKAQSDKTQENLSTNNSAAFSFDLENGTVKNTVRADTTTVNCMYSTMKGTECHDALLSSTWFVRGKLEDTNQTGSALFVSTLDTGACPFQLSYDIANERLTFTFFGTAVGASKATWINKTVDYSISDITNYVNIAASVYVVESVYYLDVYLSAGLPQTASDWKDALTEVPIGSLADISDHRFCYFFGRNQTTDAKDVKLDDVRLYNGKLTKDQIATIIPNGSFDTLSDVTDALVVHYDFEGNDEREAKEDKAQAGTVADTLNSYVIEGGDDGLNFDLVNGTVSAETVGSGLYAALSNDTKLAGGNATYFIRAKISDFNGTSWSLFSLNSTKGRPGSLLYTKENSYVEGKFTSSRLNDAGRANSEFTLNGYPYEFGEYINIAIITEKTAEEGTVKYSVYWAYGVPTKAYDWTAAIVNMNVKDYTPTEDVDTLSLMTNNESTVAKRTDAAGVTVDDFRLYNAALTLEQLSFSISSGSFDLSGCTDFYGVQRSTVTGADGSFHARFVGAVNGYENYSAVGYEIILSNGSQRKKFVLESATVYSSILASSRAGGVGVCSASYVGGEGIMALTITNIPEAYTSYEVRTFVKLLSTRQKQYSQTLMGSLEPTSAIPKNQIDIAENGVGNYKIVYGNGNAKSQEYAEFLQSYVSEKLGIALDVVSDSVGAENAIYVKGAAAEKMSTVSSKIAAREDFAVYMLDGDVYLVASDRVNASYAIESDDEMMMLCMMKFVDLCREAKSGSDIVLFAGESYIHLLGRDFSYDVEEFCTRYQALYGTYSSRHEGWLQNNWLKNTVKAPEDLALIEALLERMGASAVLINNSSSVLYNGYIKKLDTENYSRTAKIDGESVKIPQQFAEAYFGTAMTADENGYVDISAYCNANAAYSLYVDGDLAIIAPAGVVSFADPSAKINGYTNKQYCDRMRKFFSFNQYTQMTDPVINAEQSRVVLEEVLYPKHTPDAYTKRYQTTYSPGILVVEEEGKSVIYASYEVSTILDQQELATYTVLKKSTDGGASWTTVVDAIPNLRWASPFEDGGIIYLMGSDINTGNALIAKVAANGTYDLAIVAQKVNVSGTSPGSVVHANGRIYKAYLAATLSAAEGSDLLKAKSWTLSDKTNAEGMAYYGNEGSMVTDGNGKVYQVLHTNKINESIVLELSADGKTYTHLTGTDNGYVEFPTCVSKNSVVYDENSGRYLSLANIPTLAMENSKWGEASGAAERQRNVLALVVSTDLIQWSVAEYILVDREMTNPYYSTRTHAFQYVDFKIDGNDIVMVVREAVGYTNTYHDGNYCTFYRIENFRNLY